MGKAPSKQIYRGRMVHVLTLDINDDGKTSFIYKVRLDEVDSIILSTGSDIVQMENRDSKVTSWDIGTRGEIRHAMRRWYVHTDVIVFRVNIVNKDHMDEIKEQIDEIIKDGREKVPLFVMANNEDDTNSRSKEVITEELGLTKIADREWSIVLCSAANRTGLREGSAWLVSVLTGKMIKDDIIESLKTSVKDVTQATAQMKEKTNYYGFGKIRTSLKWILSGCKG